MDYYQYLSSNQDLLNVLGLPKQGAVDRKLRNENPVVEYQEERTKKFDGNAYPHFKYEAGLTKLYTDNTQYNIEVNSPIKAYNTTKQK